MILLVLFSSGILDERRLQKVISDSLVYREDPKLSVMMTPPPLHCGHPHQAAQDVRSDHQRVGRPKSIVLTKKSGLERENLYMETLLLFI